MGLMKFIFAKPWRNIKAAHLCRGSVCMCVFTYTCTVPVCT